MPAAKRPTLRVRSSHVWLVPFVAELFDCVILSGGLEPAGQGVALCEIRRLFNAETSDLFDVLAHMAYNLPTITRKERVDSHKQAIFQLYPDHQQEFLDFVLGNYVDQGFEELSGR